MIETILKIITEAWAVLGEMAPYLLFGFLVAGILSVLVSPETVEKHLGGKGLLPVVKASLFGVPLPLCSCGVIPVSASIRRHRASKGATTSFLLSTPQTGVDSIVVTYALLGPVFAIFRPIAALVTGIIGGGAVEALDPDVQESEKADVPECTDTCCTGRGEGKLKHILRYGFITLPADIGPSMLVGILIAGVLAGVVPKGYFADKFESPVLEMLAMMVVGIPIYVCATASVPIAAGLMHMGISPGAALVFLVAGPASNAATFTTILKVLGRKTAVIYLATVAVCALGSGLTLEWILTDTLISEMAHEHELLPGWASNSAAVLLLVILALSVFWERVTRSHQQHKVESENGETGQHMEVKISGMSCSHCSESVKRAVSEIPGVKTAEVSLDSGTADIRGSNLDRGKILETVKSLGYEAEVTHSH